MWNLGVVIRSRLSTLGSRPDTRNAVRAGATRSAPAGARGPRAERRAAHAALALLSLALANAAAAQGADQTGALAGLVQDEAGHPLVAARVDVVNGGGQSAYTDDDGAFLLRRIPLGDVTVSVRRLGFQPREVKAFLARANATRSVTVVLTALPQRIATVQVKANRASGPMAEFYHRLESKAGGGHFFTRAQIDSIRPHRTTDLLSRVPGLNFRRADAGVSSIRSRDTRCSPLVWVDGTPAATADYDPDLVNPRTIEGIEIYSGVATVPPMLAGPAGTGSCGVIAIWTRLVGDAPREPSDDERADAAETLARLIDSTQVFTEAQVDQAAQLTRESRFSPVYPPELRRARATGVVVTEFVVDATGHIEWPTVGVVYSPHPLFTAAVSTALESALFTPAQRHGHPVRQLVQLPVHFVDPEATRE